MNIKSKNYNIPEYMQSKGMRGEVIRQVVNYLGKVTGGKQDCSVAIITAHNAETTERAVPGVAINLKVYAPESDSMFTVCPETLYRQVEAWMPRRIEDKYIKVRLEGTKVVPRYFKKSTTV